MRRSFVYLSALLISLSPADLLGGQYSQDFSEELTDTSLFGGNNYAPYRNDGYLVMTQDGRQGENYWKLPLLDAQTPISEFEVEFDLQISGSGGLSDGFSITFGNIPDGLAGRGELGFRQPHSLIIGWDTYANGGEGTSVEIFSNISSIANHPHNFQTTKDTWTPVVITWKNDMLNVSYNGTLIAENLPTDGFEPKAGDTFAFAAAAGGDSQSTYIDNVSIRTGPSSVDPPSPPLRKIIDEQFDDAELEDFEITRQNISVSGGFLKTSGRGTILTKEEIVGPKRIKLRVRSDSGIETFSVAIATDGNTVGGFGELSGLLATWSTDYSMLQWIDRDRAANAQALEELQMAFPAGQWFDIEIIDNITSASLIVNGATQLDIDLSDYDRVGNKVALYSREIGGGSTVDYFTVEALSPAPKYQIIEGNFTWQEAKADAEAKGGRLAVLDTQEKIDATNSYLGELASYNDLWIGLEGNNTAWRWITGEQEPSPPWYNKFNAAPTTENAGYIIWSRNDASPLWNAIPKDSKSPYLLEILDQTAAAPFVAIDPLYESPTGESITLDATPTLGFPTEFTYQWCFNGFKIPANLGGTASSINIDNLQANEGTWSVTVTNSEGIFEKDFEYRLYSDSDSDGLSDAFEELISETDIDKEDTDNDGLSDAEEFNTYRTNPNSPDSDSDGFTDLYEVETAYDPNSAESVPDALVNIMTAIEVKFNAALGATYAIEFSTDNQNWDVIEDDIVGEGGAVERLYSKQNFPTGFFRVERRDQ